MKRRFLLLLCIFFVGCATNQVNVTPFGPDTYQVISEHPNPSKAKSLGIQEANNYCHQSGKNFMPVSSSSKTQGDSAYMFGTYDLTFRCLDTDDPELYRPDWGKAPDVVIESK